jgi:hypothetical protein
MKASQIVKNFDTKTKTLIGLKRSRIKIIDAKS